MHHISGLYQKFNQIMSNKVSTVNIIIYRVWTSIIEYNNHYSPNAHMAHLAWTNTGYLYKKNPFQWKNTIHSPRTKSNMKTILGVFFQKIPHKKCPTLPHKLSLGISTQN